MITKNRPYIKREKRKGKIVYLSMSYIAASAYQSKKLTPVFKILLVVN